VTPNKQRQQALTLVEFRLFPFRSPLLGEFLSISVPPGTEMFYFPGLDLRLRKSLRVLPRKGFPIRASAGQRPLAPHRSLSQLATPFIACTNQAIHHKPLVA
jgi:hypothetical protein